MTHNNPQDDDAVASDSTQRASVPGESIATPHPRRRRHIWLVVLVVLIVMIGIALVYHSRSHRRPDASDQPVTPNVNVATVSRGSMGQYVEALGTVTPLATVNLYPQITGRVLAVHYSEGQLVRKGEPLIDLDPRPYQAQLLEVQGTLEHDRALLLEAQIDLARYKDASANNAISRQTTEDQEQVVAQYKGTVKNDLGQVQYAETQLAYCHLAAPISGRIGLRLVDEGNTVFSGSSTALAVITQLQPITVVFNVAEDNLDRLHDQIERRGALTVDAYDRARLKKLASGMLLTLDNQIDTTTGTVRFRGQFDNTNLSLYPNQFVNARLLTNTLQGVTLVPSAAVQHNGVNAFVYRVIDRKAKVQAIREIASEGDTTAVEGVQAGDVVAVSGFDKLQDGTTVNISTPQGGSAR